MTSRPKLRPPVADVVAPLSATTVPPCLPPTVTNAASESTPTREELRARCRARAARARGITTERKLAGAATNALARMSARLAAGTATPEEQLRMQQIERMHAACGGDLTKMFTELGLAPDLVPELVRAANSLKHDAADANTPAAIARVSRKVVDALVTSGLRMHNDSTFYTRLNQFP